MTLWHYTDDKGHREIGDRGHLLPLGMLVTLDDTQHLPMGMRELVAVVWLTDLAEPWQQALGLTSHSIHGDRTAHRYRVLGGHTMPWTATRRIFDRRMTHQLEQAPGALPVHWYVAFAPVPVVYDP